jgi:hypothetical protein
MDNHPTLPAFVAIVVSLITGVAHCVSLAIIGGGDDAVFVHAYMQHTLVKLLVAALCLVVLERIDFNIFRTLLIFSLSKIEHNEVLAKLVVMSKIDEKNDGRIEVNERATSPVDSVQPVVSSESTSSDSVLDSVSTVPVVEDKKTIRSNDDLSDALTVSNEHVY